MTMGETYLEDAGQDMLERLYDSLPDGLTQVYDTLYDFMSAPVQDPGDVDHLDTIESYAPGFDAEQYLEG